METIEAQYRSWRGHVMRCRNKQSKNAKPMYSKWKAVQTTDKLFKELFGYLPKYEEERKWQKRKWKAQ